MRPTTHRAAATALVLLVLVSALPVGPISTAAAQSTATTTTDSTDSGNVVCLDSNKLTDAHLKTVAWSASNGDFSGTSYVKTAASDTADEWKAAVLCGNNINTSTDAQQIEQDMYGRALSVNASSDILRTSYDNNLETSKGVALELHGKKAYIQALNNGSTKTAALAEANQSIEDYYAVKQRNLAASYNTAASELDYIQQVANNESGVSTTIDYGRIDGSSTPSGDTDPALLFNESQMGSYTLVNGSTVQMVEPNFDHQYASDNKKEDILPAPTSPKGWDDSDNYHVETAKIEGYDSGVPDKVALNASDYGARWAEIEAQSQNAKEQMATVHDELYNSYQAGELNASDFVSAQAIASDYSPTGDYQAWAAATLTKQGLATPDSLNETGHMNVTDIRVNQSNETYQGLLISDENPQSGQFEANQTYNASNLTGMQAVITDDTIHELSGEFRVRSIKTADGETRQNLTYDSVEYQTTNTSELRSLLDELAEERAEIEAREQALNQSRSCFLCGVGGGGGGAFGSAGGPAVLVLGGAAAVLLLAQILQG
jgi:hypothetical protein